MSVCRLDTNKAFSKKYIYMLTYGGIHNFMTIYVLKLLLTTSKLVPKFSCMFVCGRWFYRE